MVELNHGLSCRGWRRGRRTPRKFGDNGRLVRRNGGVGPLNKNPQLALMRYNLSDLGGVSELRRAVNLPFNEVPNLKSWWF